MQTSDSYNRGGFIAFLFSMIFSLAFFAYIGFVHPGINLKEVPEEATAAGPALAAGGQQAPAFDAGKVQKPWEPNDGMVAHGATVYKSNCAVCHGDKGMGDGVAGQALVPPPRNFVEGKWTRGGDSISLFKTIEGGSPGTSMAAFKETIPAVDRWALVQFVRSVTKNKVADDPAKLEAFGLTSLK
jgi:mono/diheme cytochrome c family protein